MTLTIPNVQATTPPTVLNGFGFGLGLGGAVLLPVMAAGVSLTVAGWCAKNLCQAAWKAMPTRSMFPTGAFKQKIINGAMVAAATFGVANIPSAQSVTNAVGPLIPALIALLGGAVAYIVTDVREATSGRPQAATRRVEFPNLGVTPPRVGALPTPVAGNIFIQRLQNPVRFSESDERFYTIRTAYERYRETYPNISPKEVVEDVAYNAFCNNPWIIPSNQELLRDVTNEFKSALGRAAARAYEFLRNSAT